MASEFGLAQQYSYMNKTFDTKPADENDGKSGHSFVFEPIFTSGICVLPNASDHRSEMSEALHINAGRLLCKYLSEEWDFSYNFDNEDSSEASVMGRIRPWNAMMLISNDIMRYAEESDDGTIQNIDVNAMEKHANQYISQQIFNILTAQAVTTDYDQNYFRRAGIDIGETIRLDANDLFMSLAGPVAIAYAESVVPEIPRPGRKSSRSSSASSRGWISTTCSSAPSTCRTSTSRPRPSKASACCRSSRAATARRWSNTRPRAMTPRRCTTCTSSRTARRWCRSSPCPRTTSCRTWT